MAVCTPPTPAMTRSHGTVPGHARCEVARVSLAPRASVSRMQLHPPSPCIMSNVNVYTTAMQPNTCTAFCEKRQPQPVPPVTVMAAMAVRTSQRVARPMAPNMRSGMRNPLALQKR